MWQKCTVFYRAKLRGCVCSIQNFVLSVFFIMRLHCSTVSDAAGSIYCDVQLREAGFNGEEIRSGSVLVVKSHKASYSWTNVTVPKVSSTLYVFCYSVSVSYKSM